MTLRQVITKQLQELTEAGTWVKQPSQIPGVPTFRWTREEVTPSWARQGSRPSWPGETYDRHIFLTLVSRSGPVVMRVCACPWVRAQDSTPPLWLVGAILADPELAFDTARQTEMRHARRGGRSGDGVRR
jgi:hypothetical protein